MMLRSFLLYPAIVLGALATQVIATVVHPQPALAAPCADLVIGVDGTGSVPDPRSIVKTRLGATATIVQYPGSIFPIGLFDYDTSKRMGINAVKRMIRDFHASNPCGTVHGTGHSQGAVVLGDAIAELHAEGMDTSFITADLLSDPRHPGQGIEVALAGLRIPGYTMTGERGSMGAANVTWYCTPGDPICDWPRSWYAIFNVPFNFARLHGSY